jgi:hypothetical protein
MRQKRFQKGSVRPRKHGKNKVWVAQWWEDRRKKSKVLGRCTTKGKSEAEAAMAVILKPQNEDAGQTQEPLYTFGVYLEQVFLPMCHRKMCHRKWKESTRMTTEPRMVFHPKPAFGPQVLLSITRDQMQMFLDKKADTLSRSIVDHLRWDVNNVFPRRRAGGLESSSGALYSALQAGA